MKNPNIAFIALGSNLHKPRQQVTKAFAALADLPQTALINKSSLYQSKALTLSQQNSNNTKDAKIPDYINAVACLQTTLTPHELLKHCQEIENNHGRIRKQNWGPRTLDLDILLYDNIELTTPELIIPHPETHKRNFVLYPLIEIAPELVLPSGEKLEILLQYISDDGLVKINN